MAKCSVTRGAENLPEAVTHYCDSSQC